jgi:hypothetical protein
MAALDSLVDDDRMHVQSDSHDQEMWPGDSAILTPTLHESLLAMLNNFHSASGLWDIPSEQASMDDDLAFVQQLDFSFLDDLQVTARDGLDLWPTPPAPISDLVHLPTFEWKNTRPELLAAVIALSAVDGPSPAVRKFGFALQATVRRATIQRVG